VDPSLAQFVRLRADGMCEYCHMPSTFDRPAFEIEHIIAKQHDGPTNASNLAWACFACNKRKGPNLSGIDDRSGKIVALFHPRRHK